MECILKLRRLMHVLHRDIGYLAVGLTIIFSVSGIAVNHIRDWNPNYEIAHHTSQVNILPGLSDRKVMEHVFIELKIESGPSAIVHVSPTVIRAFWDKNRMDVNMETGKVEWEIVNDRPLIRGFNRLHLNELKKSWTYISDLFAVSLIFLAVSGMFLLKGKNGMRGRGTVLVLLGVLLPVLFLLVFE